jgi:dienelactone hydrolase
MRGFLMTAMVVLVLVAGLAPAQVHATTTPEETAHAFAQSVVAKDGAAARAVCNGQMAAAMTDAAITQLLGGVAGQVGDITSVGAARYDDKVAAYRRYRVPVNGAKGATDFQVVIDKDGLVVGLGLLPHVEPPTAAEAKADSAATPTQVDVNVGAAGSMLPGTLALPRGTGPFPAIVLVHGSGPNDRDENILGNHPFRDLAWGLAAQGIATLRYDKRSFAAPQTLAARGNALTVKDEVIDDAVAAVALLRARPEIDPKRIYVLGHSLGGMLAPRIARAAKADGMIIMAGATRPLPEVMIEQTQYLIAVDGTIDGGEAARLDELKLAVADLRASQRDATRAPSAAALSLGAPVGYYTDLEAHDAPTDAAALDIPILVLQGGRDYQVTLADFANWKKALAGRPRACLKLHDELDHLMRSGEGPSSPDDYAVPRRVAPVIIEDIAGFVREGCRPTPGGSRP